MARFKMPPRRSQRVRLVPEIAGATSAGHGALAPDLFAECAYCPRFEELQASWPMAGAFREPDPAQMTNGEV